MWARSLTGTERPLSVPEEKATGGLPDCVRLHKGSSIDHVALAAQLRLLRLPTTDPKPHSDTPEHLAKMGKR